MYWLIALTVLVTIFHDAGLYAGARRTLVEGTRNAARAAAALDTDRNSSARRALEVAEEHGVTVFAYDQSDAEVEVWAQIEVDGTWVLGLITGSMENRPSDRPYTIQHVETARKR